VLLGIAIPPLPFCAPGFAFPSSQRKMAEGIDIPIINPFPI
jgi:hypothetical protein